MRPLILTVMLVLGMVACGDDAPEILDTDAVEAQIRAGLEGAGSVVEDVMCPDERDTEEGDEFSCDVSLEDGEDSVDVTQTGGGEVTFELPEALK